MTPLRQRMIREMELRRFAQRTVESYLAAVIALAAFFRCSPDKLGQYFNESGGFNGSTVR
jgi:Phage integrase, N-terminal SAM-like domain